MSKKQLVTAIVTVFLIMFNVPVIANHGSPHGGGGANSKSVDCDGGGTILAALAKASEGDTILISGTCTETFVIAKDHVTLVGVGGATIDASGSPTLDVIQVLGTNVSLKDLTITGGFNAVVIENSASVVFDGVAIISPARDGVRVRVGASARFNNSTVTNAGDDGIQVSDNASARMENCTITGSGGEGIVFNRNGAGRVTNCSVTSSGRRGIWVRAGSAALIEDSTISGSGNDGVSIDQSSRGALDNNIITGNAGDGVQVETLSSIQFDTSNLSEGNTGWGLRCSKISYIQSIANLKFGAGNTAGNFLIATTCGSD